MADNGELINLFCERSPLWDFMKSKTIPKQKFLQKIVKLNSFGNATNKQNHP
jgi:hypothetical protein